MDNDEDVIYLRNLRVSVIVGRDAWQRPLKPQPLIISVRLKFDVKDAGYSDDIKQTTSYGLMCKDILGIIEDMSPFDDLLNVHYCIADLAFKGWGGTALQISAKAPKGSLRAEGGVECQSMFIGNDFNAESNVWLIRDLKLACIIGVNDHERLKKQIVVINLRFAKKKTPRSPDESKHLNGLVGTNWESLIDDLVLASYKPLSRHSVLLTQSSLLKSLLMKLSKPLLQRLPIPRCWCTPLAG